MAHHPLDPHGPRGTLLTALLCGLIIVPAAVLAQSTQHRMMVFEDDAGGGPQVLHFTGPDVAGLRTPDFVRKDLPIFNEHLRLDDMQRMVVQVLLDAYLDAFHALAESSMPTPPFGQPGLPMAMGDEAEGGGETLDGIVQDVVRDAGDVEDLDVDMEAGGQIAIAIRAGSGEGAGELPPAIEGEDVAVWAESPEGELSDEAPGAGVFIALSGPEGVEIPDEVREKLEQKAQEIARRLMERIEEAQAEGLDPADVLPPPASIEDRRAAIEQYRVEVKRFQRSKEALTDEFLTQVRSQLTAEQTGNWPGFERAVTRVKTLPAGRLDGERTDLLTVVKELALEPVQQEELEPVLESYEIALDHALRERNDYLQGATGRMDEAMQKGEHVKALGVVDGATRLRVAVRSVNERYTEEIAAKLPAEAAATFRSKVLRRSYPRVYRTTRGAKAFAAATEIEGLDPDTQESIRALSEAYAIELAPLNERIRETIHQHQPKESRRMIERLSAAMERGGGLSIGGGDDPIRDAFEKRAALDERYMKQLHALLTPDQIARLPKLPSEVRRGPFVIQRSTASD